MGAWGTGVFDNDGAGDLLAELRETPLIGRESLIRALWDAANEQDYLERDGGESALAAAAVVAAALLPDHAATGMLPAAPGVELLAPSAELVDLARHAVDRAVAADSEWRELWEEAGDPDRGAALAAAARVRSLLG